MIRIEGPVNETHKIMSGENLKLKEQIEETKEELEKAKERYKKNIEYRQKNHPIEYPTCGSVFKNIKEKEDVCFKPFLFIF